MDTISHPHPHTQGLRKFSNHVDALYLLQVPMKVMIKMTDMHDTNNHVKQDLMILIMQLQTITITMVTLVKN